ncbi:MAG: hypothetical protein GTO45_42110 [Candidatus Aminicenantes bacterium]|nr:hypothetical protein [Candidatus Aminicenantes bacterium]NIM85194.1 hypothetical protein [Candidatus Aminicenantes bacterium]NIN24724.1 hypothetical protein [Candidatus Aminicenantes bacterium]NIN48482.1 hypothetical protein [Candidatus Aminicenantes bacterium]NIN91382.1 hypothetical protein [Candidatus Aminicenantes bacterium]
MDICGKNEYELIDLLERPGFLVSAAIGDFDFEVRIDIINRLGQIGGETAIPVLKTHVEAYKYGTDEIVARAANNAIKAIEFRIEREKEMRRKKRAEKKERQKKEDDKILSQKRPKVLFTNSTDLQFGSEGLGLETEGILVVDDNEKDLKKMVNIISREVDLQIFEARNLEEALEILKKKQIVMLVTDIVMPMYKIAEEEYKDFEKRGTTRHSLLKRGIFEELVEVSKTREVIKKTSDYSKFAGFILLDEARKLIPWLPVIIVSKYANLEMAQHAIGEKVQGILSKKQLKKYPNILLEYVRTNFVSVHERLANLGRERLLDLINESDEEMFTLRVLIPLFHKLGYRGILYTHGPKECGLDLVFYEVDLLGVRRYIGAQVKTKKIHKSVGGLTSRNVITVLQQIQQAFESTLYLVSEKKELDIDRIFVISSKSISHFAREYIRKSLIGKVYAQHIEFFDAERIVDLMLSNKGF